MLNRVLVIGAAGDIGVATAESLLAEGFIVVGLDQHVARGNTFEEFFIADLRLDTEIRNVCQAITEKCFPLWGIVFSAGIYPIRSFADYTLDLWDEVHAVNVRSIFLISHLLHAMIVEGGRIIIVASGAAHLGSMDCGYSSSKAAAIGLVRSLAKELAPRGILVNAVCPGVIETQMSARMSPVSVSNYMNAVLLKRMGKPQEVAACIRFLLDVENTYMTGASIDVNGGLYAR
jgi:3-oxoacyl-[acyl-carrier protein] reductase